MIDTLHGWISAADAFVWGPPLLVLLFGTHIFLTIRTAFMQRHLLTAIRLSVTAEKGAAGDVSPFAALTTALAATITTLVGIGVPSKYFTLPLDGSARAAAVALNRARRLTPQTTK